MRIPRRHVHWKCKPRMRVAVDRPGCTCLPSLVRMCKHVVHPQSWYHSSGVVVIGQLHVAETAQPLNSKVALVYFEWILCAFDAPLGSNTSISIGDTHISPLMDHPSQSRCYPISAPSTLFCGSRLYENSSSG